MSQEIMTFHSPQFGRSVLLAAEAEAAFGQIHILVNHAGCNIHKPAQELTWQDRSQVFETNLRGTFFVAQAVARRMVSSGMAKL